MTRFRPIAIALVAATALLGAPGRVRTVAADDIAGTVVRCAALTDFVAPAAGEDGSFTLFGIGPGRHNPFDDPDHHSFQFSPGIGLDPALVAALADLASGDRYTCLKFTGVIGEGASPVLITELAIPPTTRLCPTISEPQDGLFHFVVVTEWWGDLVNDADALIRADPDLRNFLRLLSQYPEREMGCLIFSGDSAGGLRTLTVDVETTHCGPIASPEDLVVGGVVIADAGRTSADLLPPKIRAAALLLAATGGYACVDVDVAGNRWQAATLSLGFRRCGDVTRSAAGLIEIDELAIPSILLTTNQAARLESVVAGQACLTIDVVLNAYGATVSQISGPSPTAAPSPTTSPTATDHSSPSASPSASSSPSAAAAATHDSGSPMLPTGAESPGGGLIDPFLVVALATLSAVSIAAYVMHRRRVRELSTAGGPALPPSGVAEGAATPDEAEAPTGVGPGSVPAPISLTPREQEVLGMLFEGVSNKEIGARLFISESTAGVHVSNVMTKLGARSRAEAAAIAYRVGLASADRPLHH